MSLTPEQIQAAAKAAGIADPRKAVIAPPLTIEQQAHQNLIDHLVNVRHTHQEAVRKILAAPSDLDRHVASIKAIEAQLTKLGWKNDDTPEHAGGPPQVA